VWLGIQGHKNHHFFVIVVFRFQRLSLRNLFEICAMNSRKFRTNQEGTAIMSTMESTVRNIHHPKVKQNCAAECSSSPVRLKQSTKAKLTDLLGKANKLKAGRKIKPDDVIGFGLDLVTDEHLEQICSRSLTNKDRLEMLFRKVSKEKRGISRDEFLGMLLDGKIGL
jgi:hypothetical protein